MNNRNNFTPRNIIEKKFRQERSRLVSLVGLFATLAMVTTAASLWLFTDLSTETTSTDGTLINPTEQLAQLSVEEPSTSSAELEEDVNPQKASSTTLELPLDRPTPLSLSIPAIGLDATFTTDPLGLNEDSTVEVPRSYDEVGWYELGPTPGDQGPAIVLGHVDSIDGPAVLYGLDQLSVGDSIYVERSDGLVTRFVVETLDNKSQTDFPTEEVYENLDYAALKIITCSGTYLEDELRYTHNLIVTARLVGLDFENTLN
jgi:sortase (surface protein transpeptidase)